MNYALARKQEAASANPPAASGLRIGEPGDALEREADRIADAVASEAVRLDWSFSHMRAVPSLQRACDCGGAGHCAECQKRELRRKSDGSELHMMAPPIVHEVLRSPGAPLDAATRSFFEARFGRDFSQVRVHTDVKAAESARAVNALAYTVGSHIAFSSGRYSPDGATGRQLLAHELTHVVQQTPTLARKPDLGSETLLQRKAAASGTARDRVNRLAALLEGYANRADAKLADLGSTDRAAPVRANLQELRIGISRLRQLATQEGSDTACQAALSGFAPQHLRTASSALEPVPAPPPLVAVGTETPVEVATKSLTVEGANTAAESEADRVAAAIASSQPAQFAVSPQALSLQRFLDSAAAAELDAELPTIATETAIEEAAVTTGEVAAGEALETAAVVGVAGGPPGWVIALVIVAVVAIVAGAGYLYYRSRQSRIQGQTQPQAQPQPRTQAQPRAVPKECEDQARSLATPDCNVTATLEHSGGDPLADLFCEEKTNSPCEFRVEAASGRARFDAIRGRDVYECKCGYQSLLDAINRGEPWARGALDKMIEQIRRHLRVVKDCGLQYRIIVSNEAFATYLRQLLGVEVDVIVEPFEPCD
jgi:hypothetical protein